MNKALRVETLRALPCSFRTSGNVLPTRGQIGETTMAIKMKQTASKVEATEETTVDVSASNALASLRTLIGRGDKEVSELATSLLAAKNEWEAGPATMLITLTEAYCGDADKDGNREHDLSEFFPRPVADAKDEEGINGPHEFFEAPKPDKDGVLKVRKCNFFTETWDTLTIGKTQNFILSQLRHFEKGGDETKAEEKYRQMPADKRVNLKKKTQADKSRGRQIIRKSIGVHYVMYDLSDYADRVRLELDADDVANFGQYPFNLIDVTSVRKYRPMSIGDLMKVDVRLAVHDAGPEGSLYDAIIRQLKRGAGGPAEGSRYANVNEFFKGVAAMNHYLDLGSEDGRQHFEDIKIMLAKKGNSPLVEQIGTLNSVVRGLWSEPLQVRFGKIMDAKIAAENVEEEKVA